MVKQKLNIMVKNRDKQKLNASRKIYLFICVEKAWLK